MFKIKRGTRRIVFLIKDKAIKIPNIFDWTMFIFGIVENLNERYWWCADGKVKENWDHKFLAKIIWGDRFGFIIIQKRYNEIPENFSDDLLDKAIKSIKELYEHLPFIQDLKKENLGLDIDNKIVVIDYGYFGLRNWYYGNKRIKN